jgi:hypothetical protein
MALDKIANSSHTLYPPSQSVKLFVLFSHETVLNLVVYHRNM